MNSWKDRLSRCLLVSLALVVLPACEDKGGAGPNVPAEAAGPAGDAQQARPVLDRWTGQWNGPEGTFLKITRRDSGYAVTIQNLDGPLAYDAKAAGDHIEFARDGKTESIRATDGPATGMKWLQDKKDCLTIVTGEGYCRD